MALIIRELESKHESAWDDFVDIMPDGTFFHRAGWRQVIEQSFGHRSYYVFAEQDGAIVGSFGWLLRPRKSKQAQDD